jgi:microcystin-dependent protein
MANFDVKESIDTKSISTGVLTAGDNIMPMAGDIIMFAGATAPSGWAICDGTSGTPDLRSNFVVGANASGNVGAAAGNASHSHTYAFGNPTYGNSAFSHGAYGGAFSTNNSHSDHSHNWGMNVATGTYVGSTFIQATNASGTSKCLRSGHAHNENFNINTGNMVVSATDNSAATPNHNHNANFGRTNTGAAHTHTVLAASASGNASGTTINIPYLSLNYIMKL